MRAVDRRKYSVYQLRGHELIRKMIAPRSERITLQEIKSSNFFRCAEQSSDGTFRWNLLYTGSNAIGSDNTKLLITGFLMHNGNGKNGTYSWYRPFFQNVTKQFNSKLYL